MSTVARNIPHIILCKGESNDDDYLKMLRSLNVDVTCLPLLQFTWKNLAQLADCVSRPHDYSGLILTSIRAVDAVKQCINSHLNGSIDALQPWSLKNTFCVGPKTSADAWKKLQLKPSLPEGLPTGNVCSLIESIVKSNTPLPKCLLFPCSSIANTEGPSLLEKYNIKHELIHVYDTQAADDAPGKFNSVVQGTPDTEDLIVVIFSPSNYRAIASELKSALACRVKRPRVVAVGPTTKAALEGDGVAVDSTMSKPTPQALCDILLASYSCQLKTHLSS